MRLITKEIAVNDKRAGERGAALVMTLMVAALLLAAGGALIMTTSMSTTLAVDATAESQAYYAAEAGVNASINVLRGNTDPATHPAATFSAVCNSSMNSWLTYNGTISGNLVVQTSNNPVLGYSIAVSDPDAATTPVGEEPKRLLVHVTGYGPKGSFKRMEMVFNQSTFDYSAPSTILVVGNDDKTTPITDFGIGDSNAKTYSGFDHAKPTDYLPVFGTTDAVDLTKATLEVTTAKPNTVGPTAVKDVAADLPTFLQSADNARAFLTDVQATAADAGRYFTSTPSSFGTDAAPKITFVDGNCDMGNMSGAGLLVVTGTLTMSGNPSFNGLILVMGDGNIVRDGAGNGDIYGAMVVAKFARTWPASENGQPHPFLSPSYVTSGGGSSTVGYDSAWVKKALKVTGGRPYGVREY